MNAPTQFDQALEALRQEHRSIQPPPTLEASILRQAQLSAPRHTVRNWSRALVTAAALAIAIVLLYIRPTPLTVETHTTPPSAPQTTPFTAAMSITPATPSTHQRTSSRPHPSAHRQSTPNPGPFVPLPTGVGLPEPTQAILIRTRIDTSSLRSYGLTPPPPGAPQTVLAEFLVGEDGLPRAIRLVP
jgi:hypothetical protein